MSGARTYQEYAEALMIFAKYTPDDTFVLRAEHDQIWSGPDDLTVVSVEDRTRLDELGWFVDGDVECWSLFV